MKRTAITLYALMAIGSWFLISGWEYADLSAHSPDLSVEERRRDAGFASAHALLAFAWPITVPLVYCVTGFAQHGWKPVWE